SEVFRPRQRAACGEGSGIPLSSRPSAAGIAFPRRPPSSESRLTQTAIAPVLMTGYETAFPAFAEALGESFARYGFAVIADHGLDEAVIAAAHADAKAFFALPGAVKQ